MKRKDFIRQLVRQGCYLHRHGARYAIYLNPKNSKKALLPRHAELRDTLCELIRKQLGLRQ